MCLVHNKLLGSHFVIALSDHVGKVHNIYEMTQTIFWPGSSTIFEAMGHEINQKKGDKENM